MKKSTEIVTEYPEIEELQKNELDESFSEPAHIPVMRQLAVAVGLLIIVFTTTYIGTIVAMVDQKEPPEDLIVSARLTEITETEDASNPFATAEITGQSGFVWDVQARKVLFSKNADEILPLASVTKLMTALVAYELLEDSTKVDISIDAIRTDGDSGLLDGESFSLKNLTDIVLVASSNDGAEALGIAAAESVKTHAPPKELFVHAMNLRAAELGLTNTRFNNATGLDISQNKAGAYSTARDVAILMEYIISNYPEVTALTKVDSTYVYNESGAYHEVDNTNQIVNKIDGLLASKTGYTELAGGNLVVAFNAGLNRPIIVSVLGSTFNKRFEDVLLLSTMARKYIAAQPE